MINAAILGLGRWGTVMVNSVQGKSDSIRFTRAVVRTPGKHAEAAEKFGIDVGDDYAAVLADPEIDAIVIATPHTLHVSQCIAASEAGKHVLCDKPFTVTTAEAEQALAAADKAGVACVVGFQRRFLPAYEEMRARIERGDLGTVFHVEAQQGAPAGLGMRADNWRNEANEFRGGAMGGHGIHVIDQMIGLLGKITSVDARSKRHVLKINVDDTTYSTIEFASGASGYMGTILATAPVQRFQVFGDKGWAEIRDHRRFEYRPIKGEADLIEFDPPQAERAELECFAEVVNGKATFPVSNEEALHGQAVFDAIADSIDAGGPVNVG